MKNFVDKKGERLLRRVAAYILKDPKRYDQDTWKVTGVPGEYSPLARREIPACGTIACLGGWINILTGAKTSQQMYSIARAAKQIGLKSKQVHSLFVAHYGWPEPFYGQYDNASSLRAAAKVAAKRIKHFIKTGE